MYLSVIVHTHAALLHIVVSGVVCEYDLTVLKVDELRPQCFI